MIGSLVVASVIVLSPETDPQEDRVNQRNVRITEGVLLIGGSLKPASAPTAGLGYGFGWGQRPMIAFEAAYSNLNKYAFGAGRSVYPPPHPGYPVSRSRLWDLNATLQMDVIQRRMQPKTGPFVTAGFGYLISRFTTPEIRCCTIDVPGILGALQDHDLRSWGIHLGGGARIQRLGQFGIKPDLRFIRVFPTGKLHETFGWGSETHIRFSIGLFFRHEHTP
jgi:hypothetical protein